MSWPIQCAVCVEQRLWTSFDSENGLREHIAVQHVLWMPYECFLCPKTLLPTKVHLKQHYEQVHPRKAVKAIFTYEEDKKKELRRILMLSKTVLQPNTLKRELPDNEPTDFPTSKNKVTAMEHPIYSENLVKMSEMEMKNEIDIETIDLKQKPQNSHEPDTEASFSECRLCGERLHSSEQRARKQHIWQRHMPRAPIHCRLCSWQQQYVSGNEARNCLAHIRTAHPKAKGKPLSQTFKDNRKKLAKKLANTLAQAFAVSATATASSILQNTDFEHSEQKGVRWTDHIEELHLPKRRPSAQKQNVKKDIPNKKATRPSNRIWCTTCRRDTSKSNKESHLWLKHLKVKRYSCRMCDYTAALLVKCRRHASAEHGCSDVESCITDRKVELADEYAVAFETAFGNGNVGRAELLKSDCNTCGKVVQQRGAHVWQMHMTEKRYECTLCEYSTVFGNAVRGHVKAQHKGADVRECVVDRKMQLAEEFADAFEMAFGSHPVDFRD